MNVGIGEGKNSLSDKLAQLVVVESNRHRGVGEEMFELGMELFRSDEVENERSRSNVMSGGSNDLLRVRVAISIKDESNVEDVSFLDVDRLD